MGEPEGFRFLSGDSRKAVKLFLQKQFPKKALGFITAPSLPGFNKLSQLSHCFGGEKWVIATFFLAYKGQTFGIGSPIQNS